MGPFLSVEVRSWRTGGIGSGSTGSDPAGSGTGAAGTASRSPAGTASRWLGCGGRALLRRCPPWPPGRRRGHRPWAASAGWAASAASAASAGSAGPSPSSPLS